MPGAKLSPSHALLAELSLADIAGLARQNRLPVTKSASRAALIRTINSHLDLDELSDALCRLFPKPATVQKGTLRLDRAVRLAGETAVHASSLSNPSLGQLLLELRGSCLVLRLGSIPLFLENRWPVIARDAGEQVLKRLYAGFVRPNQVHPAAQAPPPPNKPYILDQGYYGLRGARLRIELKRTGVVSFRVVFLRYRTPGNRPEYLLLPIA